MPPRPTSGWSARFDEPVELPDGDKLVTLGDAIQHLARSVPKQERDHPAVVTASTVLTDASESRDFIMHARIATLRALNRHRVQTFNHDLTPEQAEQREAVSERRKTHWGKRKLKRDL